jgi:hypothetical protein
MKSDKNAYSVLCTEGVCTFVFLIVAEMLSIWDVVEGIWYCY